MNRKFIPAAALFLTVIMLYALGAFAGEEPKVKLDISNLPFKGPENAPVVLVVFSDYL